MKLRVSLHISSYLVTLPSSPVFSSPLSYPISSCLLFSCLLLLCPLLCCLLLSSSPPVFSSLLLLFPLLSSSLLPCLLLSFPLSPPLVSLPPLSPLPPSSGSYFARNASYSHSYTRNTPVRSMFVSRVLVGDHTLGSSSYVRPPSKDGGDTLFYDSCVDDIHAPSIFVVFDWPQIYPEFLLTYKEKASASDNWLVGFWLESTESATECTSKATLYRCICRHTSVLILALIFQ